MIIHTNNASVYVSKHERVATVDQDFSPTSSKPKKNLVFRVHTQPQEAVSNDGSLPSLPLNFDTGYAIGAFIGDGWVDAEYDNVYLSNVCLEIREEYMKGMEALAGGHLNFSIKDSQNEFDGKVYLQNKTRFTNRKVRDFLFDAIGHHAENKHLPPFWRGTSIEFRWGILSGMLDTDGTVSVSKAKSKPHSQVTARYETTSSALITDFMRMCHSLGIYGVYDTKTTKTGKPYFLYALNATSIGRMKGHVLLQKEKHHIALDSFEFRESMWEGYASPELSKEQLQQLIDAGLLKNHPAAYTVVRRRITSPRTRDYIPYCMAVKIAKMDLSVFKTDADLQRWRELVLDFDYEWHFVKELKLASNANTLPPAPIELRFAV